ncbi:MAG: exodeoxyribonuclease V subunit beta [Desulforegulaceae bacterium]|nr:exodeoxyribonuclease V subunit beta [Desulforegulaceae bacterium]
MKVFDPFETNIKNSTTLIEASAGTGKTYTITSLILRLVLEKDLSIKEILVVTFTEAAALELKDRILKRLRETLKGFESLIKDKKENIKDPFILKLVDSYPDPKEGMVKISSAIRDFDLSCIFTIHGFCYKVLSEYAFETKNFFESEILGDESVLIGKSADDFYRNYIDSSDSNKSRFLFLNNLGPDYIADLVKKYMSYPELKIIAKKPSDNLNEINDEFFQCEKEAGQIWETEQSKIREILTDSDIFKKTISGNFEERKEYLDKVFESKKNLSSVYTKEKINRKNNPFMYFKWTEVEKGAKKGKEAPFHIFFEKCEELHNKALELEEETLKFLSLFKKTGFKETLKILSNLKDEQKVLGFGDFLFKVKYSIENDNQDVFKNTLRTRYKSALIDEFQDTDLVQYEIFKKVFKGYCPLFFIGDPKQAIYRFRGADIYAYLNARKDADHIFTLNKNYRSSIQAVNSVNNVFSFSANPFCIEEINYFEIGAVKPESDSIFEEEKPSGGMEFVLMSEKTGTNQTQKENFILKYIVSEITNILSRSQNKKIKIEDKEIKLSDIAILVRDNKFGRKVRKYLEENNLPSVLTSEESVFDTEEAQNILEFLDCAENPANDRKIKKVLTGGLFLMPASKLNKVLEDESKWAEILDRFKNFNRLWTEFSVMEMLDCLFYEHNILNIQAKLVSGERRITNLIHIFEILHEEEVKNRHGKKSLVNWFAEKVLNNTSFSKEYQLRMESDKKKLKIMTVHKSKGLEFPIVFCGFLPKNVRVKNEFGILYHDEETKELILDFNSGIDEKPGYLLKEESIAEDLRVFYVAVTRAKYKTYIFLDEDKKKTDTYATRLFKNEDGNLFSAIENISKTSKGSINFKIYDSSESLKTYDYLPFKENLEFKNCVFKKELKKSFQISSFSLVSLNKEKDDERFDSFSDEKFEIPVENQDEFNIFNFPKGAFSGIFFHSIFEDLNFCALDDEIEELVKLKLEKFGFDNQWLSCVCEMVRNVLNKELKKGLFLKNINKNQKITELEFYYPLKEKEINFFLRNLCLLDLNEEFKKRLENITANESKGFMKGFIDLVFEHDSKFYILDWKSNHLGFLYKDYKNENLFKEICNSLYFLQYYIYSYALDKYLKYRLGKNYSFEKNFGGVYYLFLRGIDSSENTTGVFYDLPLLPSTEV